VYQQADIIQAVAGSVLMELVLLELMEILVLMATSKLNLVKVGGNQLWKQSFGTTIKLF
jgi:hypothetical protein